MKISATAIKHFGLAVFLTGGLLGCAQGGMTEFNTELPDETEVEPVGELVPPPQDRTIETQPFNEPVLSQAAKQTVLEKYKHLDPNKYVPRNLLEKALVFWDANQSRFPNKKYISIVDFSKRSNIPRWFFINMSTGAVSAVRVAHGTKSDLDNDGYAERFSNEHNSNASSIGFYRVSESYEGKFGYSARIDGLSTTNSNARGRAVVIHGAWYVWDSNTKPGRTYGCFGVSKNNSKWVVDNLKNGTLLYAAQSGVK